MVLVHPPHRFRPYRLRLNGAAELCDAEGNLVPLSTRKALLIVAVLALGPQDGYSRAELSSIVWEDSPSEAARAGLRTALVGLRTSLPETILADKERVRLMPGSIQEEPGEGEFMPGFEAAWTIDERLRRRAVAVDALLETARREKDDQLALGHAEQACALDPLRIEAAQLRETLLRRIGRLADANQIAGTFRARILRELGTLPPSTALPPSPIHPLVAAAEWTLQRDPAEACALLASTQNQWFTLSVERALDVHERVLAAHSLPTKERQLVHSGMVGLLVLNGRLGGQLGMVEITFREALANGEFPAASRLADALAYGHLSAGDFNQALAFAREGQITAQLRSDPIAVAEAQMTRSIIELHSGDLPSYHRGVARAYRSIEETGNPYTIASFQNILAGSFMNQGKLEQALPMFESCRRFVDSLGSDRLRTWVTYLEATLHEHLGEMEAARAILEGLREEATNAGQAAVASVDDSLLRVNCQLREFDLAAEALARGTTYRRRLGTVPSLYERKEIRPAVRTLRERLGTKELEAAFRKAAIS